MEISRKVIRLELLFSMRTRRQMTKLRVAFSITLHACRIMLYLTHYTHTNRTYSSARRSPFVHLTISAYETHRWTVTAERLTRIRNLVFIRKCGHHLLATVTEIHCVFCELRPQSL